MKEHGSGGGSDLVPVSPRAGRPLVPVGLSVSRAQLPRAFPGPSASAEPGSCPIPATVSWAGQALPRKWPLLLGVGWGASCPWGAPLGPGPGPGCPRHVARRPGALTSLLLHPPPSPGSVPLVNSRRLPGNAPEGATCFRLAGLARGARVGGLLAPLPEPAGEHRGLSRGGGGGGGGSSRPTCSVSRVWGEAAGLTDFLGTLQAQ